MQRNVNDVSVQPHYSKGGNSNGQVTLTQMWGMTHVQFKKLHGQTGADAAKKLS